MFKYIFALIMLLIFVVIGVALGANNSQMVDFNYIIAQSHISLSTLVAIIFGLGFLFGWFISAFFYIKLKIQHMTLARQVKRQTAIMNQSSPPKA